MSEIVELVREGLTEKVRGLETALLYVRDPREIERLQNELAGANAGLAKLNEADTRSPEEVEKIVEMLDHEAHVESSQETWSEKTPHEKFLYQIRLFVDRLNSTAKQVDVQYANLAKVLSHLRKTKGDSAPFMNPVITQFEHSIAEVAFSRDEIGEQLVVMDEALAIAEDEEFFGKLLILNKFMHNPMSLPSLTDERNAKIDALEAKKGVK